MRRMASPFLAVPILLAIAAAPAHPAAMDITLGFASLPSAQGWSYVAQGSHAGVSEGSVFSVAGGVLTQNTIGQANGTAGGGLLYQITGGITTTEPKQFRVRARCLAVQGSTIYPAGQGGTFFGFTTGTLQYGFSITPTQVFLLAPGGFTQVAAGLDNSTAFHDYLFDWSSASSFAIHRDGVAVGTGSGGGAVSANRVIFGDGTGGANAHVEISALRFIQDVATPAHLLTWKRLKALYRP